MPALKSPADLRRLCIMSVVKNMDALWAADYRENYVKKNGGRFTFIDGPFNSLDSQCIKDTIKEFCRGKKMTKMYLNLLIVPNLTEINLNEFPKLVTDEIVDLICIRCRNVTVLEMEHCDRVSSGALIGLVESFHESLVKVSFAGNKVTDSVLEAIGRLCKKLRILCIDNFTYKFTRHGIERLLFIDSDKSLTVVGKNLQVLRMTGCSFEDETSFISDALQLCPSLRCVTHFCLWESIAKICEQNPVPPKLKLTGVRYDVPIDLWALQDRTDIIPSIPKCIPEIQHLSIQNVEEMEMPVFELLTGCGKTLRSLHMDWHFPFDFIEFVGLLCPQLDTFFISFLDPPRSPPHYCGVRQAFENYIACHHLSAVNNHPWRMLKQLSVSWPGDPLPLIPSSSILFDVFKNASASLVFIDFQSMSDPDVDSLLCRALHAKYFENLEMLRLHEARHLTVQTIWDLILLAPKLKSVDIYGCDEVDFDELSRILHFVHENNYDIEIIQDFWSI